MKSKAKDILEAVKVGSLSADEALLALKKEPFADIGYAKVDFHRALRQGQPEVIYGAGKTPEQILGILEEMKRAGQSSVLITRLAPEVFRMICQAQDAWSESQDRSDQDEMNRVRYYSEARLAHFGPDAEESGLGTIVVATAGTSDIPVAEEAALTAQAYGNMVVRLYDVGVSGLHRLLAHLDEIMNASVIIAIAGMEGALVSVIAGLADCPVIGVPTSIGYGSSFKGTTALLSMLNSCASGVCVVNIDNGFGAGYLASMINHMEERK